MARTVDEPRSGRRSGVSRFLEAHEGCASEFDVHRTRGGEADGGLRLVCNGCGARASYDVSEPGVLKVLGGPAEGGAGAHRTHSRSELERWLPAPAALPWWVPNAYIVAVIAIGLVMVAFGVINREGDDPALIGGEPSEPVPGAPVVSGAAQPAAAGQPKPKPKLEIDPRPRLDAVTVFGRFEIGMPAGWLGGSSSGAVVFRPAEGGAELRVFLEPGDEGPSRLAAPAERFLRSEHPGARVRRVGRDLLRGAPVIWLEARYEGGVERAGLLSESGYEYLLLSDVEQGAGRRIRSEAAAALQSFKAR